MSGQQNRQDRTDVKLNRTEGRMEMRPFLFFSVNGIFYFNKKYWRKLLNITKKKLYLQNDK